LDKPKSARRDLVDVYLNSTWPPADLVVTALDSGIVADILDRLARTDAGRGYIQAIENDASRSDA
jgi:hypothetical protein